MTVFYDLEAEQVRLERLLADLDWGQWTSASGAQGWTIADVVLHLAQSEEAVTACIEHPDLRAAAGGRPASTVEEHAAEMVRAERPEVFSPSPVFGRWMRARRRALDALRGADPQLSIEWVAGPVKPATRSPESGTRPGDACRAGVTAGAASGPGCRSRCAPACDPCGGSP